MPGTRIRRVSTAVVRAALVSVVLLAVSPGAALAQAPDWDVPAGHFFTQTGGTPGCGYLVRDEAGLPFWSEFRRLGGVQAVGYPASKRFQWDGFTVQVFQRVVFQWRPEAVSSTGGVGQAYFVNVFDRLGELGKNDYLLRARQTPPPRPFADAGKSWPEVVQSHLAVLEPFPAIKAKYHDAVGDAIQANGLPVSDVTDMGNHYALRAQRVVFQQWKEDVPWAKAGQVTVALGGDIAKETGVLPDPEALKPTCVAGPPTAPAPPLPAPSPPSPRPPDPGAGVPPPGFDPTAYLGQGDRYDCPNFRSQAEAQAVLRADPTDPNILDQDRDGIACESNPPPRDTNRVSR
ncbi:MAG TPA: excalibur calcium-binding domain-containing protein [Chloroflexota bacterium]